MAQTKSTVTEFYPNPEKGESYSSYMEKVNNYIQKGFDVNRLTNPHWNYYWLGAKDKFPNQIITEPYVRD